MFRAVITPVSIAISLLVPPLAGIGLADQDISPHLDFPPLTPAADHTAFSWCVWLVMFVFVLVFLAPIFTTMIRPRVQPTLLQQARHRFPGWGYAGLILIAVFWTLAWNRFDWFSTFQVYTFTPIWIGYIVTINALTHARTGHCLLTRQPFFMLGLFLLSAVFWWYYEYLNGFIHNWYYVGIESLTTNEYVFHSTIAYATVLPAVASTITFLISLPRLNQPFRARWKIPVLPAYPLSLLCWGMGIITLSLAAYWPEMLFPFVWIAPLFIVAGARVMLGKGTVFASLTHGDWRPVIVPALAALMCGFFWELWNSQSYAHWEYNIPFVDAFLLFEMPAIGYAGYLPFGLVCLAIMELLPGSEKFLDQQFHP